LPEAFLYVAAKAATHKATEYVSASLRGLGARSREPQSDSREGGRSEQRPYGILVQQCTIEMAHREKSKEPAGRRRYERRGAADPFGLGGAAAGTACCAPTGYCYGKARPGVESGSELPHSRETWQRLIWRSAVEEIKRAGGTPALRKAGCGISLRLGGATAGAASSAPTESSYGNARVRLSGEKIKRGGPLSLRVNRRYERRSKRGLIVQDDA
jgi:hypothetical protein